MARLWAKNPGDEVPDDLAPVAEALQAEVEGIEALADPAACHICGSRASLTVEHAPSKRAGNVGEMYRGMIDHRASIDSGAVTWRQETVRGATFETLCASCNNNTGTWYNPAYVKFSRECGRVVTPDLAGQVVTLRVGLHRQRLVKQALASLVATSQRGLTDRFPDLRALLVGKEDKRSIAPIRLWLFGKVNIKSPLGMYTGLTIALNHEQRTSQLVAGFSFGPLGWIMTLKDGVAPGALDVSPWTEIDYHDKAPYLLELPCQWAISPYPGDFRGADELPEGEWSAHGVAETPTE